jgi:anti-sigma-K factor RskA
MNHKDDKLSALLRQWREIEPRANFEANVRRRIRLAQSGQPERVNLVELLERLMWRPALAAAAAVVVVSSVIGSSAGVLTARQTVSVGSSELQFLSAGTLAGGYVKLASGGVR